MQQEAAESEAGLTPWDTVRIDPADTQDPAPLPPNPYSLGPGPSTGAWTIPLICIGVALIACCLLIPAADENRRLAYEAGGLKADLEQLQKQAEMNDQFLKRVSDDPALAERLAQRQMKMVREGTSVLELKGQALRANLSPFLLVTLPPPAPLPEYQPLGGRFASLCRHPRTQLYMIGGGLFMIAVGLVLSHGNELN